MRFLNYTGTVRFNTHLSAQAAKESIKRLVNTAEDDNLASIFGKIYLRGKVQDDEVILYRARPLSGHYFYTLIFYGKFVEHGDKLVLEGIFSMSRFVKGVFAIFAAVFVLLETFLLFAAVTSASPLLPKLILLLFLPFAGVLISGAHLSFKSVFRSDVGRISATIEKALKSAA
jgi:hypothetical protein